MAHSWHQLIKWYEDGIIVLMELKWRLFESFTDKEQARDFVTNAPEEYRQLLASHCYPEDKDDEGWSNIRMIGSNMSMEMCQDSIRKLREGVKTYRNAL